MGNPIAPRKILSALLILSSPPGSTSQPSFAKYSAPALIVSQSHLKPPIISDERSTIDIAEFTMSLPIPSPGTVAI